MHTLKETAKKHLSFLCETIENRCVGSKGNQAATKYFQEQLEANHWQIESQEFDAFDWESEKAFIETKTIKLDNIIGRKGADDAKKIAITAHIDAKKGSPGAIDNGTGVVTMLLLSELLREYNGSYQVELAALNGEDDYSVPGQMVYIQNKQGDFSDVILNINIDGAGLDNGNTSFALMDLKEAHTKTVKTVFTEFPGLTEGEPWVQGDHSIFLQYGVPAVAISSEWLLNNLENQQITHTENDNLSIVDINKITELAEAIAKLVSKL